ncbi:MAG: C4-dicarboxylate ABC transporter permease [Desulfobacterales bacterium]|nr:MAG: C4-dicarboxylate ABC transporter permease [Desulfobacterales bacterium]
MFWNRLAGWIDGISHVSASIIMYVVVALTMVLGYEIIARYAFNSPTKWAFDLSYMMGGAFFLFGQAHTLANRRHVRIDIFYSTFSPRTQAIIDVIFYLVFFFPLWIGLLIALYPYVMFSWSVHEKSMQSYWQPVIYPFKTLMPMGVFLLVLQGGADCLRQLMTVFGKGTVHES